MYQLQFASSHHLTDEDERTLVVKEYSDVGSMYMLVLKDGSRQSVGKQLIESIEETDG